MWDGLRGWSVVSFIGFVAAGSGACTGQIGPPQGPPTPNPGCMDVIVQPMPAFGTTGVRNGEFSVAYDPRPVSAQGNGNGYVYAATQELTLDPAVAFPSCIIAKKTVVYVSDQGGVAGSWKPAVGNSFLPGANNASAPFPSAKLPQAQVWATDEVIRVASDGTVYLSILEMSPFTGCSDPHTINNVQFNQVDIFVSAPGANEFHGLVVGPNSDRKTGTDGSIEFNDHPTLAVNPLDPTQAVVFYTTTLDESANATQFRTVRRAADGSLSLAGMQTETKDRLFSNLAFDEFGKLYSADAGLLVIQWV
jgi:hypothetical protein